MLATDNGHKDVFLILIQRGANVDLVDAVSVHVHMKESNFHLDHGKCQ